VHLDRPVNDRGGGSGDGDLRHRHQIAGRLVARCVDDVAGAVAQQPCLLDLHPRLRDLLLHHALVRERPAEGDARL
jgi:hypothetical protein